MGIDRSEDRTGQSVYLELYIEKIVKNNLDLIVLYMLKDTPMCGYDVIREIFERYNIFLSQGTVYPLLYSLKGDGILQVEYDMGNMRTKIYTVTERGMETVNERLTEFIEANEYIIDSIKEQCPDDQRFLSDD